MFLTVRQRLRDDDGISLVEVLVAMTILGIALTSFAGTLAQSLTSISQDEQLVRANQLAADELEGLRSIPWAQVGFYSSDTGYTATVADPVTGTNRSVVTLGTNRPAATVAPLPQRSIPRDGISYQATQRVVWVDDPGIAGTQNHKELWIDLAWSVRGKPYTTSARTVRTPTTSEVAVTPPPVCTTGHITSFTVTPNWVEVNASNRNVTAVVLRVATCTPATSVTVARQGIGGSVPLVDEGEGTSWTATLPANTFTIVPGTYTWTATAVSPTLAAGHQATDEVVVYQPSTTPLEVVTVGIDEFICVRRPTGNSPHNYTLQRNYTIDITTSGGPSSVQAQWTGPRGSMAASTVGNTGDRWRVTIPSGTTFVERLTTITVTATRTQDGQTVFESVSRPVRYDDEAGC